MDWDSPEIEALMTAALAEDVGSGDMTVAATVPPNAIATARLVARRNLVCAGLPLVEKTFSRLDADISVDVRVVDGQRVAGNAILVTLNGNAGAILSGEQVAVNLLARLCGIATLAREYVRQIEGTRAKLRDSRFTMPGMRRLEQYAVQMGGGTHYRSGLFDAIVLTPSNIAAVGGIKPALDQAHSHASRLMSPVAISAYEATGTMPGEIDGSSLPIQIEVRNEAELREALAAGAESILLNDEPVDQTGQLAKVARAIRHDCVIEVTGDISLGAARLYAEVGVDYLSPRAITTRSPWAKLGLLVDSLQEK